jgi:hypothetical protein
MPMGVLRGTKSTLPGPLNAPSSVVEILFGLAHGMVAHDRCLAFHGPDGIAPMLRLADLEILIRSQAFS